MAPIISSRSQEHNPNTLKLSYATGSVPSPLTFQKKVTYAATNVCKVISLDPMLTTLGWY
jgi:hypothetical protein